MKIRVEIDGNLREDEVIIRAKQFDETVLQVQQAVSDALASGRQWIFYRGEDQYYLPLSEILFFQTEGNEVQAHTKKEIFTVKYRLYELEETLPGYFMRVSKSTILNIRCVYAMTRSISSTCAVQLADTHKQVYVSRYYYKPLRERLEEKRRDNEKRQSRPPLVPALNM